MNVMIFSFCFYFGLGPEDGAVFTFVGWLAFALTTGSVLVSGSVFIPSALRALRHGIVHLDLPIALGLEVLDKPAEYDLLAASLAYNRVQKTSGSPHGARSTCLRASKRKTFVAACVIEYRGQSHEGILRDVSETGIFVHTDAAIEVQEDAKLWVTERSGATHAMDGCAVRQGRYEHGIGLIPSQGVGFVIQNTPTAFLEMLATL